MKLETLLLRELAAAQPSICSIDVQGHYSPTTEEQLAPRGKEFLKVDQFRLKLEQQRQCRNYYKSAKDLEILDEGDTVRVKPYKKGQKEWDKGVVLKRLDERTYEIKTQSGSFRRNGIDLKKAVDLPPQQSVLILDTYTPSHESTTEQPPPEPTSPSSESIRQNVAYL